MCVDDDGAAAPAPAPGGGKPPVCTYDYYSRTFEFLDLGILAYIGNDQALAEINAFDSSLAVFGGVAFLLWKSVYITKQVSLRNRVLILFDWLKAKAFGRDLSQF